MPDDSLERVLEADELISRAAELMARATTLKVPDLSREHDSLAYWQITLRHLMDQLRETMRRELT